MLRARITEDYQRVQKFEFPAVGEGHCTEIRRGEKSFAPTGVAGDRPASLRVAQLEYGKHERASYPGFPSPCERPIGSLPLLSAKKSARPTSCPGLFRAEERAPRLFSTLRQKMEHCLETQSMPHTDLLSRITVRPDVFGGKPIIRDMRIAVEHVLGMLAAGDTAETILDEYPGLTTEDIQACLLFAHRSIAGEQVHERVPVRGPS